MNEIIMKSRMLFSAGNIIVISLGLRGEHPDKGYQV